MDLAEARRLKELEKENLELKKILAEAMLEKRNTQRGPFKKVLRPTQKRQTIEHVVGQRWCSERRACRYLGLHRSTFR
mgnify:FL=1|jgi:hypothetical protein